MDVEAGSILLTVLQGVRVWSKRKSVSKLERRRKLDAVGKVMAAATATKAYLYDRDTRGETSRERERELSAKWQEAALAIDAYDAELFRTSQVKSLGWADPREWELRKKDAITVNLDKIVDQCEWVRKGS